MNQLQTHRTTLPTRSAVGRRGPFVMGAFVACAALVAQLLSACSDLHQSSPETSVARPYPDLSDPLPPAAVRADEVAQIKSDLIQVRDSQERVAAQQQAFR